MNKLYPIPYLSLAGIIMMIISIVITIPDYEDKKIINNGKLVNVIIEKVPEYCEKKSSRDILVVFFNYRGKMHSRNVSEKWCSKIIKGEILQMKTNEKENEFVFVWEKEAKIKREIGGGILLTLMGLFFIFKGYTDENKKSKEFD